MSEHACRMQDVNLLHLPHVYTVFKYILESGRHGLPNVVLSADIVHRLRPWHICITVSVAYDTRQAEWGPMTKKMKMEKCNGNEWNVANVQKLLIVLIVMQLCACQVWACGVDGSCMIKSSRDLNG